MEKIKFKIALLFSLVLFFGGHYELGAQINIATGDVKCYDGNDGWIRVTVPNATPPITYKWDDGLTGQNRTNLKAGEYVVTITDATKCDHVKFININQPQKRLDIIIDHIACPTTVECGEYQPVIVRAEAKGGTIPYSINGSAGVLTTRKINRSQWVTFQVTDENGCTASDKRVVLVSYRSCPKDPNDILGPAGYEDPKWISINDTLDYTVRFENDPLEATAPAQRVVITHDFDETVNPFSFRVGSFGFGDLRIEVPPNKSVFQDRLDLTATTGVFVDVVAGFDIENNRAFWNFTSIDPNTGLQPNDPLVGFLPVNDTLTGSGEGFVTFSIKPLPTSMTGDTVLADADIIFNINEAIETNIWSNVIDAQAPTTLVNALPDTSDQLIIDLSWSAADDLNGSGIREVDIYVSDNGAFFEKITTIPGDSIFNFLYEAEFGHTYEFYSIGIDNTGNTEIKSFAETATFVLPEKELIFDQFERNTVCNGDTFLLDWTSVLVDSLDIGYVEDLTYTNIGRISAASIPFSWTAPSELNGKEIRFVISDAQQISCVDTSQTLLVIAAPDIDAGDPVTICGGEFITLIPSGANTYEWSPQIGLNNPSNTIQSFLADSTQQYFVEGIDAFGCRNIDSVQVTVLPVYTQYIYAPICEGDSILVNGQYEYQPGEYAEQYSTADGCDSTVIFVLSYLSENWLGDDIVFVDSAATGNNDGSTWEHAFTNLQDALCLSYSIDSVNEIWTAKGSYYPSNDDMRMMSFVLQDSVKVYGGFQGNETLRNQRDPFVNETVLSGDLGIRNNDADNAFHIVRVDPGSLNSLLDGFKIKNANANGIDFVDQRGGAVFCEGVATMDGIRFSNSLSLVEASYILNMGASAKLTLRNCQFDEDDNAAFNQILNSNNAELIIENEVQFEK